MSLQSRSNRPLAFAHLGDLHIADAKQRNFQDLLSIVAQIETEMGDQLDFVVLPGDNADNGLPRQYALVATALRMLRLPVHAIPGDHDMEQGGLDAFYAGLQAAPLPKAVTTDGALCLFLDFCGSGEGGPDFRLGSSQTGWLTRQLEDARSRGLPVVLFMHAYPADLKGAGETAAVNGLLARHDVALVDMGHTHYNELANDGRTLFAATRSTGQIEEGPPGFSVATLDRGVVSWRFKPLDDAFPFVVITSPADHRLLRTANPRVSGEVEVRAMVFGRRAIGSLRVRVGDGAWQPMRPPSDDRCWTATLDAGAARLAAITVEAVDESGRPGRHTIEAAGPGYVAPPRAGDGSDADSIGAWPENGIFGTQLGPNRNGGPS